MNGRLFLPGLLVGIAVFSTSLACNFSQRSDLVPAETIPVSTEALESLKEEIEEAGQSIQESGQATLVITEAELTSLVAFELQKEENPILQNPQIYLREGQMLVVGTVQLGDDTTGTVLITLSVSATADGKLDYEITSAMLGPLPVADFMLQQFSDQLDAAFTGKIDPRMDEIFIDQVTIADGRMTLQGHTR
jgi:hypothetical protein